MMLGESNDVYTINYFPLFHQMVQNMILANHDKFTLEN